MFERERESGIVGVRREREKLCVCEREKDKQTDRRKREGVIT